MVSYWPSSHTVETWAGFLKSGATEEGFGKRKKSRVEKMQPDDYMIFYITGEKKFAGYAKICSGCYHDEKPRFPEDRFPYRVEIEMIKCLMPANWVPLDDFKHELNFYQKYGKHYGLFFRIEPSQFDVSDGKRIIWEIERVNSP